MTQIAEFPTRTLRLDANGVPVGHDSAISAMVRDFRKWVNDLPDSVYHLGDEDADSLSRQLIARYLHEIQKGQR